MTMRTRLNAVLAVLVAATVLGAWAQGSQGYPLPAALEKSWTLEVSYRTPRPILVADPDGTPHWYWYLPYTLVNRTGEDRMFVPEVLVASDCGQPLHANQDVPTHVFTAIKARLNDRYLVDPVRAVGKLLQGDDNALDSVVIWPAPAQPGVHLRIFFGGLSGETQPVANPVTGQDMPQLSKTLMLEYQTPGKPPTPAEHPVLFESATWVMR
jgi:hypothetical protein